MESSGRRLVRQFGATDVLLSFLDALEVLRLQQLDRWMYEVGISRVQVSLSFRCFYFSHYRSNKNKETLFLFYK